MKWPHAPGHWLFEPGIYMVTSGTYGKAPHLNSDERRDLVLNTLFSTAEEFGWLLQAWAVLDNHYHFIAASPEEPKTLRRLLGKLHMTTSKQLNIWDQSAGRKVWFQSWDKHITFERSYLARLNYVHNNPVKHGLVSNATDYRWCSAAWFEQSAPKAFVATVSGFKTDSIREEDDF